MSYKIFPRKFDRLKYPNGVMTSIPLAIVFWVDAEGARSKGWHDWIDCMKESATKGLNVSVGWITSWTNRRIRILPHLTLEDNMSPIQATGEMSIPDVCVKSVEWLEIIGGKHKKIRRNKHGRAVKSHR